MIDCGTWPYLLGSERYLGSRTRLGAHNMARLLISSNTHLIVAVFQKNEKKSIPCRKGLESRVKNYLSYE
jgi:hypothetical protein